jgi:hypothetical protein
MSSSKRHFTVVMDYKEHGLYISSTPSSAAKKAVSKLCSDNKNKKVEFCIRETTQNSNKKVYGPYIGYMQKLEKPVELKGRIIQYRPISKLKNKVGKMKGGYIQGARAFIFHPAINTKNPNHISKLYYFDDDSEAHKLELFEKKLNEIDPKNRFHVPFVSISKIITKKEIKSIEHDTNRTYYNRWFKHHNNNLNKIKELVTPNNFNYMYRNKFLFNYLITYEYGGEPISNLINKYNIVSDYNWIIHGFINIFDGILFFHRNGIINCNIHVDNILFREENPSNWRMINFKVELEPEDNVLTDINNLLEIVNDLLQFSINSPVKFDMIDSVTDETFEDIRTRMLALLKKEE